MEDGPWKEEPLSPLSPKPGSVFSDDVTVESSVNDPDAVYPLEPGLTLGLFGPENPVRRAAAALCAQVREIGFLRLSPLVDSTVGYLLCLFRCTKQPAFNKMTMLMILLSSLALAIDSPLMDPESSLRTALEVADYVFNW